MSIYNIDMLAVFVFLPDMCLMSVLMFMSRWQHWR